MEPDSGLQQKLMTLEATVRRLEQRLARLEGKPQPHADPLTNKSLYRLAK